MGKNRNRIVVSVTLPIEMVHDMDTLIKALQKAGEKMNRSIFIETALGATIEDVIEEIQKLEAQKGKAKNKEEC